MTKTENYQLNQWDPEDRVIRTDFNEDNAKLDAALNALAQSKAQTADLAALQSAVSSLQAKLNQAYSPDNTCYVVGSYNGDNAVTRTISLGFTPVAVLLSTISGVNYTGNSIVGGFALRSRPAACGLEIVTNGFKVVHELNNLDAQSNLSGLTYYYIAFR